MRIFSFIGVFLLTGAFFLIINGGLRLKHYSDLRLASYELWTKEFWAAGSNDFLGLSPNAQWFLLPPSWGQS